MSNDMRTIRHRSGILHVETPEGIINIHVGLSDVHGHSVTAVAAIPDQYNEYQEPVKVRCSPRCGFRMIRNKRPSSRR